MRHGSTIYFKAQLNGQLKINYIQVAPKQKWLFKSLQLLFIIEKATALEGEKPVTHNHAIENRPLLCVRSSGLPTEVWHLPWKQI